MALLALPLELQLHILALLPLSSQLLFTYQVCTVLRQRLHPLLLPAHTLSLATWRIAAEETRHVLARGSEEVVSDQTVAGVTKHASRVHLGAPTSPATDARLLVRVLRLLSLLDEPETASSVAPLPSPAPAHPLRALCLIGWRGVGADLVRRLLCEPGLADVRTVVKTERFDRHAWTRPLAPHERSAPISVSEGGNSALAQHYLPASVVSDSEPGGSDKAAAPLVVVTQAMLVIGSRQAPHQRIPGKGVQVGYEALCFAPSFADQITAVEPVEEGTAAASAVTAPDAPLHVIFQGRYSAADALQCEAQLRCSHIRCGHCRQEIWFG